MPVTDEEAIGHVIERAYAALAFEPGDLPDWQRFDSEFVPQALMGLRVFPSDPEVSLLGLREYAQAQVANGLKEQGYSETPGDCSIEVLGDVAVARQAFTMNFASGAAQAVDFFSLVRQNGHWRIVAVVSDIER